MKYEKPTLEELELLLEGSFLYSNSDGEIGVDKDDKDDFDGDFDD